MTKRLWPIASVLALLSSVGYAATITVRQDGSGDYLQIQPALDAAAAGDTVLIGPGEYTELIPSYIPGYAWDVGVAAYVRVSELTIIGAGMDETILGPPTFQADYEKYSPKSLVCASWAALRVSGVSFRNCYDGVFCDNGYLEISDCRFQENVIGITWNSNSHGGGFANSEFISSAPAALGIFLVGDGEGGTIDNCTFDNGPLEIQSIQNLTIRDCEMKNAKVGIGLSNYAGLVVSNCHIFDCSVVGIGFKSYGARCDVADCEIAGGVHAVVVRDGCKFSALNSVFWGGSYSTIHLDKCEAANVRYSHLLKGTSQYSVTCYQPAEAGGVRHDFRGNYWGTTDGDLIASLILDGHDDPLIRAEVLYEPFSGGPVGTEKTAWGDVKAMFR